MTTLQSVVVLVFWVVLVTLGGLVLLLYRQVDRLYGSSYQSKVDPLAVGTRVPPVEVLGSEGIRKLEIPRGWLTLLFVNSTCDICEEVLRSLAKGEVRTSMKVWVLTVSGRGHPSIERSLPSNVVSYGYSDAADATQHFGISEVPFVYVLRDGTIVSSSGVTSPRNLGRVLASFNDTYRVRADS